MKKVLLTTALAVVVVMATWLILQLQNQARIKTVLQALRAIPVMDLLVITEQQVAVVHHDKSNIWLGPRVGQSSVKVKIHWGMDLSKLQPSDIRVHGRDVLVNLPVMRVIEVTPDFASWQYCGRKSALFWIIDGIQGHTIRDDLFSETAVMLASLRYLDGAEHRSQVIERLNRKSQELFAGTGLQVSFK